MNQLCLHCYVSGRVQGVYFRDSTQKQAIKLGVKGWTRNLEDGRVEVLASGEEEAVKQLAKWLWKGSPLSKVTDVVIEECAFEDHEGFEIRY
ncbi:MAG: acylphosphatase [Proteobacteria bacterium]|nr:acylphosphatase [Pseudomonadota bacterium]